MGRLTLTIAAFLGAAAVWAQEIIEEEVPDVRRYTVEVIIFEYAESVSIGTEVFEPDEPPPEVLEQPPAEFIFEDIPAEPEPLAEEEPLEEVPQGPEFILHLEDEFTLMDVAERLERLDVYKPVLHFAWTQVTTPDEETLAIDLPALVEPPEGLSGSFRLYLSRYLHLVVDLTLDETFANGEPVAIEESSFVFSDRRAGFAEPTPPRVRFRIQEDRIFKNGDLRYFDHPKFGVLARITRVEEAEPEVEDETEDARQLVGALGQ